jgi:hypothetical protein
MTTATPASARLEVATERLDAASAALAEFVFENFACRDGVMISVGELSRQELERTGLELTKARDAAGREFQTALKSWAAEKER